MLQHLCNQTWVNCLLILIWADAAELQIIFLIMDFLFECKSLMHMCCVYPFIAQIRRIIKYVLFEQLRPLIDTS